MLFLKKKIFNLSNYTFFTTSYSCSILKITRCFRIRKYWISCILYEKNSQILWLCEVPKTNYSRCLWNTSRWKERSFTIQLFIRAPWPRCSIVAPWGNQGSWRNRSSGCPPGFPIQRFSPGWAREHLAFIYPPEIKALTVETWRWSCGC